MPDEDLGRRSNISDLANKSEAAGRSCESTPLPCSGVGWRSVRGDTAAMITLASVGSGYSALMRLRKRLLTPGGLRQWVLGNAGIMRRRDDSGIPCSVESCRTV